MKYFLLFWIIIFSINFSTACHNNSKEINITMSCFIEKEGYRSEEHVVQTADGYLLTIHRILGTKGAPTVFLQHGFFASSFDWIVLGKEKALAFMLADQGYDVWIGNVRGNVYSNHIQYNTSHEKFWNFSWHEMGIYDIPAIVTYITKKKNDKIIYIGHSMGATMFFVMAIERPDVAEKVKAMFGLAPMAGASYYRSPIVYFTAFTKEIQSIATYYHVHNLSRKVIFPDFLYKYCTKTLSSENVCLQVLSFFIGYDYSQVNYTLLPLIFNNFPSGSSMKSVIHFAQVINTGKFQYFDYGFTKNLQLYNSSNPPEYNLTKIKVPVGIFSAKNDLLISRKDSKMIYDSMQNQIFFYDIPYSKFNHFDYLWAIDANVLVYKKLLSAIKNLV